MVAASSLVMQAKIFSICSLSSVFNIDSQTRAAFRCCHAARSATAALPEAAASRNRFTNSWQQPVCATRSTAARSWRTSETDKTFRFAKTRRVYSRFYSYFTESRRTLHGREIEGARKKARKQLRGELWQFLLCSRCRRVAGLRFCVANENAAERSRNVRC